MGNSALGRALHSMYMGIILIDSINNTTEKNFTPCIWGLSADLMDVLQAKMLHSMYMGIIQPGISANADIQPLPRIYGDYPFFLDGNPRKASFTPYIRGLSSPYRDSYCTFFLYPIYMRIIPEYSSSCPFPKPSPHMYGDYPGHCKSTVDQDFPPPHVWGLSQFFQQIFYVHHLHPIYTGIILLPVPKMYIDPFLPHIYGDYPWRGMDIQPSLTLHSMYMGIVLVEPMSIPPLLYFTPYIWGLSVTVSGIYTIRGLYLMLHGDSPVVRELLKLYAGSTP